MYINITTSSKINSRYFYSAIDGNCVSASKIHKVSALHRYYVMSAICKINIYSTASRYI